MKTSTPTANSSSVLAFGQAASLSDEHKRIGMKKIDSSDH